MDISHAAHWFWSSRPKHAHLLIVTYGYDAQGREEVPVPSSNDRVGWSS